PRVLQPGGDPRLAHEPAGQLLIGPPVGEAEELDRDLALQFDVPPGPHLPHPAAREREFVQFVPVVDEPTRGHVPSPGLDLRLPPSRRPPVAGYPPPARQVPPGAAGRPARRSGGCLPRI